MVDHMLRVVVIGCDTNLNKTLNMPLQQHNPTTPKNLQKLHQLLKNTCIIKSTENTDHRLSHNTHFL